MLSYRLAVAIAASAALALASSARAGDDVISLALPSTNDDVITLKLAPSAIDSDTQNVYYRGYGYGGYYGGYRGFYGGYRGFYGGYRGFGYGYRNYYNYRPYYRSNFGYGYSRPFIYGGYYGGFRPYYSNYYGYGGYGGFGGFYGSRFYGGGRGFYFGLRISDDLGGADTVPICSRKVIVRSYPPTYYYSAPSVRYSPPTERYYSQPVQPSAQPEGLEAPRQVLPPPMPKAEEGTFDYDGGPMAPVPMPQADPKTQDKPTLIPYDSLFPGETLVSVKPRKQPEKAKTGKWVYPAYGEKATRSSK